MLVKKNKKGNKTRIIKKITTRVLLLESIPTKSHYEKIARWKIAIIYFKITVSVSEVSYSPILYLNFSMSRLSNMKYLYFLSFVKIDIPVIQKSNMLYLFGKNLWYETPLEIVCLLHLRGGWRELKQSVLPTPSDFCY